MLISGANSCTSCIIHNPDKIIEIFINIERQSVYAELIEQNKINNKTKLLKKNDFNRLGIKNDRFINDIVIRREKYKPSNLDEIIKNNKKSLIIIADQITDQNNLNNKTKLLKKNDFKRLGIKNDRFINDIVIRREKYKPSNLEEIIINNKKSLIIIADQITDQNNLGNIIRTALLMGADGLLLSEHSSADINDVTSITSSGAVELLKFHISKKINRTK